MKSIFSGIGILLAGTIFFMYTKPTYDTIQATQAHIVQYNAALDKATKLQELKQGLLSHYNAFNPGDLQRLQTLLPDQVNNIGLILDLDTLASQSGMSIENVNISVTDQASQVSGGKLSSAGSQIGAPIKPYDSLDVTFTVHGTYTQFIEYLTNLEASLRIVDLVGLTINSGGTSNASQAQQLAAVANSTDSSFYTYNITLRTYWFK